MSCTVEVRTTNEARQSLTDVGYSGANRIGLHFHLYTAHHVTIGGKPAHLFLTNGLRKRRAGLLAQVAASGSE